MDTVPKRKVSAHTENRNPVVQPVAWCTDSVSPIPDEAAP
jgi:hypothetical protein